MYNIELFNAGCFDRYIKYMTIHYFCKALMKPLVQNGRGIAPFMLHAYVAMERPISFHLSTGQCDWLEGKRFLVRKPPVYQRSS